MESENTFHLKKKPSAPIPQYVNPGKARKGASRRRAFRSLPRERFLCRLGTFRPRMKSTAGTALSRRFRAALSGQAAMYLFASCSPILPV